MADEIASGGILKGLAPAGGTRNSADQRRHSLSDPAPASSWTVARQADEIQRMWQELYDHTPCGHYLLDASGIVIQVNDTGLDCLGYTREEIVGRKCLAELMSPDCSARFSQRLARLKDRAWSPDDEYRMQRKDGTRFAVLTSVALLGSEDDPSRRSRISVFDISKRKLAQEQLEKSELRSTAILHAALDCVVSIDSAGHVIEFNPAAERTFGYIREYALGKDASLLIVPARMRDAHREGLVRYIQGRGKALANSRVQMTATRSDGSEFPVEVTITPVELQDETIFTAYLRDISRERWTERELRRYANELRAISRRLVVVQEAERRELASGLHDLVGQKLTALNINLTIVKSRLPPESAAVLSGRLNESLTLVEETIESIRDVMGALRPAVLDDYGLAPGLRWYAEHFSKRTGVTTTVADEGATCRLPVAVEEAFFRIAQEALANVAKYARAGTSTVTLTATPHAACLKIADDGRGFDPSASHHPTRESGWGLMIMRERAAGVGAQLRVESAPGRGTRVIAEWTDATP
jgi:PAS domain S-box-containing protein